MFGSPAIDTGLNALAVDAVGNTLTTDQRSTDFARIINGTVDIGAMEFPPPAVILVTTDIDEDDGTFNHTDGNGTSLREAIIAANLNPDFNTIAFSDGTGGTHHFHDATPDVITLGGTELTISTDLAITGPGADLLTVSGNNASRVFTNVAGDHDVTFDSFTIADGHAATENGGGINNSSSGHLTIANAVLRGNKAGGYRASRYGGGLSQSNGQVTIVDSMISDNIATSRGAGLWIERDTTVTISVSTISGNSISGGTGGGGIWNQGRLLVTNSTISGNSAHATLGGGGIIHVSGTLTVVDSTISGNSVEASSRYGGGGMATYGGGNALIVNSTITGNSATNSEGGGGIWSGGSLTIVNSTISGEFSGQFRGWWRNPEKQWRIACHKQHDHW